MSEKLHDRYMSEIENDVHGGNTNLNDDMIVAVVIAI